MSTSRLLVSVSTTDTEFEPAFTTYRRAPSGLRTRASAVVADGYAIRRSAGGYQPFNSVCGHANRVYGIGLRARDEGPRTIRRENDTVRP
jgi:hypothetical protein